PPAAFLERLSCTLHPLPAPLMTSSRGLVKLFTCPRDPNHSISDGPAKAGPHGGLLRAERVLRCLRPGDHVLQRRLLGQRALDRLFGRLIVVVVDLLVV